MTTTAVIIFIITFLGIIYTRLPKVNIDRPSAAFFGAVAMILFGVLTFEEAVLAIDFNTIALLLGMMIVIAVLELDGFFTFIAEKTISLSKSRNQLLTIIIFVTGIASAFLVNDAVVLLFTPVIIQICRSAKAKSNPIFGGRNIGFKHWKCNDNYRQSAEYFNRNAVRNSLYIFFTSPSACFFNWNDIDCSDH
ncbi:MAG: SLC13 family permease [Ignavibacteriaceae bacterium]|nr:SLC13 family permease [Ignavibacteriaceae bacterium]